jgi:hypothetical protein
MLDGEAMPWGGAQSLKQRRLNSEPFACDCGFGQQFVHNLKLVRDALICR